MSIINHLIMANLHEQDVVALTSLPLPGYEVKIADPCEVTQKENMFKVFHEGEKKVYYFQVEDLNNFFKLVFKNIQNMQNYCVILLNTFQMDWGPKESFQARSSISWS